MRKAAIFILVVCILFLVGWIVCQEMKSRSQDKLSGQIRWSASQLNNEVRKSIGHNKWV